MTNNSSIPLANFNVHQELALFWTRHAEKINQFDANTFREPHHTPDLPLARIKKIMKLDDEVKAQMISAEVPILFSKATEIFIEELTLRAWVHTEENKRKTLQKSDIAMAISKYDQFDFLIDIVPRDEIKAKKLTETGQLSGTSQVIPVSSDQLQLLLQQAVGGANVTQQPQAVILQQPNPVQLPQNCQTVQLVSFDGTSGSHDNSTAQQSESAIVEMQLGEHSSTSQDQHALPQVYQQVLGPDGSVQHVPIQLSTAQLQFLKSHFTTQLSNVSERSQQVVHQQGQRQVTNAQQVLVQQQPSNVVYISNTH